MPTPRCILRRVKLPGGKTDTILLMQKQVNCRSCSEARSRSIKTCCPGSEGWRRSHKILSCFHAISRQALPSGATQLRVNLTCGLTIASAVLTVLLQRGEWAKATVANSCLFLQDSGFQKFRKHRPSILNPGSYRRIPCARPRRSVSLRKCFLLSDSKEWFGWNTAYTGKIKSYFVTTERGFLTQAQHYSTATSLVGKAVKTYDILYTVDGPLTLCT
ncbi:hypothetical protein AUEXF2481DRAFT_372494 [Aureobasidium subglaciale EXF-2481]|uniref:Uncharacterized protein n=1 Tax=Aureobasidium subglaciale (strain EXF-2481) TaxID=1043005 RepID=A0A074YLZ1_AURSE|nr:uncharacterized protein AUEXF2481DRAFT_372494 [Aureobasidium subglaciale EXF-2481]KAI5203544.1 hypothetical protein E4T38_05121 [Aureobasidium subglaciale]KAI5222034.1 hypothetical protein E4T40_05159 [Aureobasidium subglaciale]KAI5225886.1 hypothetical protein E4T41_04978 [Aureobasidium subglaciale]KAI5261924.1 hypothetical protein E4T46_04871 [Aureobasidium subglaciale]KEQ98695.1 hypothetical protein AUEXF2481DRAFT_372494 [Aureobasidium subglaciale EXF-2481]